VTDVGQHRLEVFGTVLLAVAALATSWAGFQATLWSGDQMEYANESIALRAKSTRASTRAGQLVAIDVGLFNSWMTEQFRGDAQLRQFLEQHFRPEFKVAFEDWIKSDPLHSPTAAGTPFVLSSYHLSAADSAYRYEAQADSAETLSAHANATSDAYVLTAVILATVMFFAGTAQQTKVAYLRLFLLGLAGLACVGAVARLFTLPHG
jgi:hypothetical protein